MCWYNFSPLGHEQYFKSSLNMKLYSESLSIFSGDFLEHDGINLFGI